LAQRQELAVNNRLSRKVEAFARHVRHGIDTLDFEQRQKLSACWSNKRESPGRPSRFTCAFPWMSLRPLITLDITRSQSRTATRTCLINRVCVHLVEMYFSILQRKVLTPNDCTSLDVLADRHNRSHSPQPQPTATRRSCSVAFANPVP
jgi:hypothetical protein